jgi:hypothetical protein
LLMNANPPSPEQVAHEVLVQRVYAELQAVVHACSAEHLSMPKALADRILSVIGNYLVDLSVYGQDMTPSKDVLSPVNLSCSCLCSMNNPNIGSPVDGPFSPVKESCSCLRRRSPFKGQGWRVALSFNLEAPSPAPSPVGRSQSCQLTIWKRLWCKLRSLLMMILVARLSWEMSSSLTLFAIMEKQRLGLSRKLVMLAISLFHVNLLRLPAASKSQNMRNPLTFANFLSLWRAERWLMQIFSTN